MKNADPMEDLINDIKAAEEDIKGAASAPVDEPPVEVENGTDTKRQNHIITP